jgi:hypothetical protein
MNAAAGILNRAFNRSCGAYLINFVVAGGSRSRWKRLQDLPQQQSKNGGK